MVLLLLLRLETVMPMPIPLPMPKVLPLNGLITALSLPLLFPFTYWFLLLAIFRNFHVAVASQNHSVVALFSPGELGSNSAPNAKRVRLSDG